MMKICILGNSHVACLKTAWSEIKESFPLYEMTFFASPGSRLTALSLSDGVLIPGNNVLKKDIEFTSGGKDRVNLSDYDVFLIVGLGFYLPQINTRLSTAVTTALVRDAYINTHNYVISNLIKAGKRDEIFIASCPMLPLRKNIKSNVFHSVKKSVEFTSDIFASENLTFLPQPAETIEQNCFSKKEFSKDSLRLEHNKHKIGQHSPASDVKHMNTKYGVIYINEFIDLLKSKY